MSLYREVSGRPWAAITAALAVGIAIGGLVGFLAGRAGTDETSLSGQVADLRGEAQSLRLALEQVTIEYRGTVRDGEVASPTEYEASRATVGRAVTSLDELQADLAAIDAAQAARLDKAVGELQGLVERRAVYGAVAGKASEAQRALAAIVEPSRDD